MACIQVEDNGLFNATLGLGKKERMTCMDELTLKLGYYDFHYARSCDRFPFKENTYASKSLS